MSDSLRSHELQHARPPCPSPTPGVYPNSYPLSQWCHPTISSPVIPFSCLQSFPASGSFPIGQLFASGGQIIGASASASVLQMNIQDWFSLRLTGLISLKRSLKSLFQHHSLKVSILCGLEESIQWKWLYYPKQSIASTQSLSSYQWHFPQN